MRHYIECELPDGRKVKGSYRLIEENGGGAIYEDPELEWGDGSGELTYDELNVEIHWTEHLPYGAEGLMPVPRMVYLHEYVLEFGKWTV